jgi:ornithine cyclodeaminase/alanine dehydrogenase-like protein (mu-crystallin family)
MIELFDAEHVTASLPWPTVVESLRAGFAAGPSTTAPPRHHHRMHGAAAHDPDCPGDDTPTLLLMPAWNPKYSGVKIASVFPTNRGTDIETINGSYLLIDGTNGVPLALLDGGALTVRRTAGASLLAASLLARPASSQLVVIGSGRLAGSLARGYAELFPIDEIVVWNHRHEGAVRLADELAADGLPATATDDAPAAIGAADIVTAATLSSEPVIAGDWLQPGTHVDLVGGFTPLMREADDDAIRASDVYVDTMIGALTEAGDIMTPIANGVLTEETIRGDLFALCNEDESGSRRARPDGAITLFKSVGHALEDLVAAATVFEAASTVTR